MATLSPLPQPIKMGFGSKRNIRPVSLSFLLYLILEDHVILPDDDCLFEIQAAGACRR
jgi:hypothetical protein